MKVILYMGISVNGFIARENDDTPWSEEEWESFKEKCKQCGNIIIGRRTFEIAVKNGDFPFEGAFNVVCSNKDIENKWADNAAFIKTPKEAIELLESKGLETAMVGGGGSVNSSFMKEGLIDEIYLDVEPWIFGTGIPLFDSSNFEYKLELLETKKLNDNTIQQHYKVIK